MKYYLPKKLITMRFETAGEISFHALIKLYVAIDITNETTNMFNEISFNNIDEVIRYGKQN